MPRIDWSKYKLVLFDFDCTLYAPNKMGFKLVMGDIRYAMYSYYERKVRKELAGVEFGSADALHAEMFVRIARYQGVSVDKVQKWYNDRYMPLMIRVLRDNFVARDGAQQLIDMLQSRGVIVGVLSDYSHVSDRMAAIGLSLDKKYLWSTEDMGAFKPAGRPFRDVMSALGFSPDEVLMIGDKAENDGQGARNAGCDVVLVQTKKNAHDPDYCVLSWSDIVSL